MYLSSVHDSHDDILGNLRLDKNSGSQLAAFKQFSPAINFLYSWCEVELCKYAAPNQTQRERDKSDNFLKPTTILLPHFK